MAISVVSCDWCAWYHTNAYALLHVIIMNKTLKMLLLVVLCFCLELASTSFITPSDSHLHGGPGKPLGRAFAKPPNVATDLDCAIKELAWDYAKNLLTNVSILSC